MVQSLPQSDGFRILFNSPELSEVQRSSFHLFLKKGITEELSKISCIQVKNVHFLIEIVIEAHNFRLVTPENDYRDCILKMKSYTCKLYVLAKILFRDKISNELLHQTQPEWILLTDLPMMTKRGHFVINGSPRVVIHQVGRAPGIYFKKVLPGKQSLSKQKKDGNTKARFYGDIIPRKGVWVRLQINKKGEIDLKLKKSKKVRAEMVQKCLEVLERGGAPTTYLQKGVIEKQTDSLNISKRAEHGNSPLINGGASIPSFLSNSSELTRPLQLPERSSNKLRGIISQSKSRGTTKIPQNKITFGERSPHSFPPTSGPLFRREQKVQLHKQVQGQLFFSPQTSALVGLDLANCLYSKTWQTRAFVIASRWTRKSRWTPSVQPVQSVQPLQKRRLLVHDKRQACTTAPKRNLEAVTDPILYPIASLSRNGTNLIENKQKDLQVKAEKEAFLNVYTSFYKKEIEDTEDKVSIFVAKPPQNVARSIESLRPVSLDPRATDRSSNSQNDPGQPSFLSAKRAGRNGLSGPTLNKNEANEKASLLQRLVPGVSDDTDIELQLQSKNKLSKKTKVSGELRSQKKRVVKKQNSSGNLERIREYLYQLFKKSDFYDLGLIGREKINTKFGISVNETQLTALDIKETINWLSKLRAGKEEIDDIDHSQNRRVRTSSELIQTQFEIGITRLKNLITKKVRNGKSEQLSITKRSYNPNVTTTTNNRQRLFWLFRAKLMQKRTFCKGTFGLHLVASLPKKDSFNNPQEQVQSLQKQSFYTSGTLNNRMQNKVTGLGLNNLSNLNNQKIVQPSCGLLVAVIPAIVAHKPEISEYLLRQGKLKLTYKTSFRMSTVYTPLLYSCECENGNKSSAFVTIRLPNSNLFGLIEASLRQERKFEWRSFTTGLMSEALIKFMRNEVLNRAAKLRVKLLRMKLCTPFSLYEICHGNDKIRFSWKQVEFVSAYNTPLDTNLNRLSKEIWFNKLHLRGESNRFIKDNKILNKVKLNFEGRITFTALNPYFIKYQTRKKYYFTLPQLKRDNTKPQLRQKFIRVFQHALSKNFVLNEPRSNMLGLLASDYYAKELCLEYGCDTPAYTRKQGQLSLMRVWRAASQEDSQFYSKRTRTDIPVSTNKDVSRVLNNQQYNLSVSELFSTKPINGALREFFSSSPLSQYMDQTNPLAEITHKRRISSLGVGGVSRESAGMTIRGIHPTHYGRICPIETPEGKNAGLVNSLAFYAKINNQGFIETPYYQVIKGQIQHELGFSFYSARQESRNCLHIAPNDIKQSKSKLLGTNISNIESIPVRVADNLLDLFKKVNPYQVDCIGISPVQILSVATSLIPFLEHNDANRALMGSNMQRQAVPLMISERPLVGTGLEARVLAESGHLVQSKVSGFVSNVSAHKIIVEHFSRTTFRRPNMVQINSNLRNGTKTKEGATTTDQSSKLYADKPLLTTANKSLVSGLSPVVRACSGCLERSSAALASSGYTLARPRSTSNDISTLVNKIWVGSEAPKPSIKLQTLTNRSLVRANRSKGTSAKTLLKYTSTFFGGEAPHLQSFCINDVQGLRYAKPSLSHFFILPKASKASFLQTATLVKTKSSLNKSSLCISTVPVTHSIATFSRSNQETCLIQKPLVKEGDWVQKGDMLSDCSAGQKGELSVGKNMLIAYIPWQGYNFEDAIVISDRLVKEQLYTSLHIERYTVLVNDFKDKIVDTNEWFTGNLPGVDCKKIIHLQKSGLPTIGTILKEGDILVGKIKYSKKKPATPHEKLVCDILGEQNFSVQNTSLYVPKGVHEARVLAYKIKKRFDKSLKNNLRPAGAPKIVHVFLGEKRNIQVGDKMSGRHGNKGIVSTILPKQDMPYLADGTPIDILLNPLGVPSRMNVGQVFECLLGLASTYLHQNFKITAFDELYGTEASQSLVFLKLYQARLQSGENWLFQINFPGKTRLTDGRSGECFDQWITVGRAYMLKLIHMVNEKIHARAIGPYALVTQQPLKGRAHKGGQRLGEMEVWAVEGFGAAYILQELLTKKSDDSIGRKEVLKAMLPKPSSFLNFLDPFGQVTQTESRTKQSFVVGAQNWEQSSPNVTMQNGVLHVPYRPSSDLPPYTASFLQDEVWDRSSPNANGASTRLQRTKAKLLLAKDFKMQESAQSSSMRLEEQNKFILGQPDIFKVLICELQALCLDVGVYSIKTESFQRKFLGVFE